MPETTTVRVRNETHATLRSLSAAAGQPIPDVVAAAVEMYRRAQFVEAANAYYARLRERDQDWQAELAERKLWDATLLDGQEEDQ